ncbi:ABC transporter family substrate-binding protein [Miniimonas sp. S16]|uniref:ABC transporter family substrate-binding protein n=1 Tax=Miniimonas sp. S16 TaxID=2171623 RepID=UPI000D526047|nr:ABC transporter family substrate-binding protein [Miniimonas sp. S16]
MTIRRITGGVAAAAALALVLTACANTPSDDATGDATGDAAATDAATEAASGGTLTVAETNAFTSLNGETADTNLDINNKILNATHGGFWYLNPDMEIVHDEDFGTFEKTSDDPLTVTYTVNDGVTWSDGDPVDADDLLLSWAIYSGYFNSLGPDGTTGDEASSADDITYFDYAGDTGTMALAGKPEVGDDGRSLTFTYSQPAADWESAFNVAQTPAHVVAKNAGLDSAGLIDLLTTAASGAETTEENAELRAVADFWNTGFNSTTLPSDPELYLSSGPFIISEIVENQSVTLVPNESFYGEAPKLDTIIMRTIGDATAAVQALQNGEVDVISPQSSADTLQALKALSGVEIVQGDQLSYDHLDLTFNNGGPFDPATYGGDAEKALAVREAFLLSMPRQAILDAIVTPQKEGAEVLNSQLFVSSQAGYADSVAENGSDAFPLAGDVEAAKAKLAEAGVTSPTVRILYNTNNPNRVNSYTLIAAAATEAGFTVVDAGDPKWSARLGDGSYDASIFGWISSGVGVSGVPQIFSTTGGSNMNGYSNAEADALMEKLLVTTDSDEQVTIQQQIDPFFFADAYGLPLFQSPGLEAHAEGVSGFDVYMANQTGVWWNVADWAVSGS